MVSTSRAWGQAWIRTAARAEAEKFSWENASDDLLRYYEMAIEKHRAGAGR